MLHCLLREAMGLVCTPTSDTVENGLAGRAFSSSLSRTQHSDMDVVCITCHGETTFKGYETCLLKTSAARGMLR